MSTFQNLPSPKRPIGSMGHGLSRAAKRAKNSKALAQCCDYPPTMRSDGIEDQSGEHDNQYLTDPQCSEDSLINVLHSQDRSVFDITNLDLAAQSLIDIGESTNGNSTDFWRPEATSDDRLNQSLDDIGAIPAGFFGYIAPTPAATQDITHCGPATPTPTQCDIVTSIPHGLCPTPVETDETAVLLSLIFLLLPPHLDPSDPAVSNSRVPIQPNNLYNPIFVRNEGTKNREGWCGFCQRWLQLRESSYNYDKKYSHGICPNTGRPFNVPVEMKTCVGGKRGAGKGVHNNNKNVCHYEGRCGECDRWIRLIGRSGPANSWWRHAFQVFSFL